MSTRLLGAEARACCSLRGRSKAVLARSKISSRTELWAVLRPPPCMQVREWSPKVSHIVERQPTQRCGAWCRGKPRRRRAAVRNSASLSQAAADSSKAETHTPQALAVSETRRLRVRWSDASFRLLNIASSINLVMACWRRGGGGTRPCSIGAMKSPKLCGAR